MSKLKLTFAAALYDRMLPLRLGHVEPEGIELDFRAAATTMQIREIFDRMAGEEAFDAAELSISEYVCRYAAQRCPFVAIPAFPSRVFRHGYIFVNRRTVKAPKDLDGKRVGVPLYTMTAAVYIRGLLQHDYGVDLSTIRWVQGSVNTAGKYANPSVMPLVRPLAIETNPARSLSDMLERGELDAVIGPFLPDSLGRGDVRRLFPDYPEVERDYFRRTRIFPIMHTVVLRRAVYVKHRFAAASLYDALCKSRERALAQIRERTSPWLMLPWIQEEVEKIDATFGGDFWPYGVEANRPTLEALVAYLHEQGMIAAPLAIEDLFAPECR